MAESRWHHGHAASIAVMTLAPRNVPLSPLPGRGFVVAMRARLLGAPRRSRFEWIIVSRWGSAGEFLSLGWTGVAAEPGVAPINLAPRQTVLAVRQESAAASLPATFLLAVSLPDGIVVAGQFRPAEGFVQLSGTKMKPRLRSKGRFLTPALRPAWHIDAARAAWIGEFIEANG